MTRGKWAVAFGVLALVWTTCARAGDLVIAAEGKCDYQIVLPEKSLTQGVENALYQTARLMQAAFKANGFDVAIVKEDKRDAAKPAILIGDTALARGNGVAVAQLKGWSYVTKVVGRDIIIAGRDEPSPGKAENRAAQARDRLGSVKGVADFLRQYAGVRFLYPDAAPWNTIAGNAKLDFATSPAFEFLPTPVVKVPDNLNATQDIFLQSNTAWAQATGFYDVANNRFPPVGEVLGYHTHSRAIPLEKYGEAHPEYFALIGGKRLTDGRGGMAQYCISNPDVQELFYKDLVYWLDNGYDSADLGQSDGFRACQCPECFKLFGTGADWNEKIWILHRNLAERVLKSHPGKVVAIASYIQTADPPKSFKTFPANVRIMLSGTNDEDFAAWKDCIPPQGFGTYIYNSCPNLATRYTPMRTPRYVETQAKRFARNKALSITRDGNGVLFGTEGPVYYVMGRMFDDPERNKASELVQEFCGAAFGKSGTAMMRFYDQLYHGIELYSEFLGTRDPAWGYTDIYGRRHKYLSDPFQLLGFLYTPVLLSTLEKDLAQAEKQADTDKVKTRVALVRREFDYIKALARVVHLHQAYQIQPDVPSRDRLLDAIDARNALIASYYDPRNRSKAQAGWTYTLFPPVGHDANHLRLAYDIYQEPMKNTCFNWDTKAMRQAALPGAKRLSVQTTAGAVTADSPQWERAAADTLGGLPAGASPARKTTVKALYDAANLYVRVECDLTPDAAKGAAPQETVELYLTPPGKDISYRFTAGPKAEAKACAASGFITDVMDPRHGQYDPDWKGDWSYESRVDAAKNRWTVLLKVPFKTLGVATPAEGASWRANLSRVSATGPNVMERSLWSALGNTKAADDRNAFGEITFDVAPDAGGAAQPKRGPEQKWREEYDQKTGGIPAEWVKLANPLPTALGPWLFRADGLDAGVKENWSAPEARTDDWQPVKVPGFAAESVGNFIGYAWYRTSFTVPAEWKGKAVRVLFGAVDEQAWVYVNGKLVREHSLKSENKTINELWEEPFTAEVAPEGINYGKANVLVVRVNNSLANGGIWRPVLVHAVEKK